MGRMLVLTDDVFMSRSEHAMKYGYARVSTKEQNEGRQITALSKYVDKAHIEIDKASGRDFNREQYQTLKRFLRSGDELYIMSLDRLGRNKTGIKEELQDLKARGVIVRCLDLPTTLIDYSGYGELQQAVLDMVNNILIEVLGMMAEQERKRTLERQAEGIAEYKRTGKTKTGRPYGRPKAEYPSNWQEVYEQWQDKKITAKAAMECMGLKRNTFYKLAKQYRESEAV